MKKHYLMLSLLLASATLLQGRTYPKDSLVLEQAVVVGMGTQKRNTITAAVSTVASEDVAWRPVTDITGALQGNVAGLNIVTGAMENGTGGEPGSHVAFNIRGM